MESTVSLLSSINSFYPGKQLTAASLAAKYGQPYFIHLLHKFLYDQLHWNSISSTLSSTSSDMNLPNFHRTIWVHPSAVATFYAPSDLSGVGGMRHEQIQAVPAWQKGPG
ncbi:hypothetical protein BJV74DRAFT_776551 [Russula compacta]|nr:hypothetical protein BJV74DRAFT_776551 [Russula compacta]